MQVKPKGELIEAAKFSIRVEDIFSMKDLYKVVKEWLDEEGYMDEYEGENYREKLYLDKTNEKGKEMWIWWRTIKYPEGSNSKTGYLRYLMNIDYHVLNMSRVEVMHKGKKLKMDKGEVEVMISANVEIDFRGEWKKGFLKTISSLFKKRIYRKEITDHKNQLYKEAYRLQSVIKRYLEAKGLYTPEEIMTYYHRSLE